MKPQHLLSVRDLSGTEITRLIKQAADLKKNPKKQRGALTGMTLGLLFLKPSVRTRVSFEVGMAQLGGQALYLGPTELGGTGRESAKDLALVLSRYLDGIVIRTFAHRDVQELARVASIPIINGLSDLTHPCQALGDLLTIQERFGKLKGVAVTYVGDGNNVCHALIEGAALTGLSLTLATPKEFAPPAEVIRWGQLQGKKSGGLLKLLHDPKEAVQGAQVVYADVWASMGQEAEQNKRKNAFREFQVNQALMACALPQALFMHCLPAHRGEEVTDEVLDSKRSIVYDQAENRLHIQKAILLNLLSR